MKLFDTSLVPRKEIMSMTVIGILFISSALVIALVAHTLWPDQKANLEAIYWHDNACEERSRMNKMEENREEANQYCFLLFVFGIVFLVMAGAPYA